jgi:hypothetical protein
MSLDLPTLALLVVNAFSLGCILFLGLMSLSEGHSSQRENYDSKPLDRGCFTYSILFVITLNILLWGLHLGWFRP